MWRVFSPALLVCICLNRLLGAAAPAGEPPAKPISSIEQRFFEMLARAAADENLKNTKKSGGGGGGAFMEIRPEGGYLVGLEVWEGDWAGHQIIRGIRGIFQTPSGRVRGANHGHTAGEPQ